MEHFLVLHAGYSSFYVGLFSGNKQIAISIQDKRFASRDMVPTIALILEKNNVHVSDLACIGVNCGPGPFTSLRVAIATANGIGFGAGMPLVSLNSLELLLQENSHTTPTLVVYNAYNNDLYYGVQISGRLEMGYAKKEDLVINLIPQFSELGMLRIIGQGVSLIADLVREKYGESIQIDASKDEPSIDMCAKNTLLKFKAGQICSQLTPIYLKAGYTL